MPLTDRALSQTGIVADHEKRLRRMRTAASAASGFDPNENPIIIGAGATAGSGSSPDTPAGGAVDAIAIGTSADASGTHAIAIGAGSVADSSSVAIGRNTNAFVGNGVAVGLAAVIGGTRDVAVGNQSTTDSSCDNQVALGPSTSIIGYQATAIGAYAQAHNDHSTAVGTTAQTTKDHQIMLGSTSEFVETKGPGIVFRDVNTSTRYLLQVASGVVVLTTAP